MREKPIPTIIMKKKGQTLKKKYIPPSDITWKKPQDLDEKNKKYEIDSEDSDYKENINDP